MIERMKTCSGIEKKLPPGILRTLAIKFSSVLKTSFGDIWRALTPRAEFALYSLICLEVKYIPHLSFASRRRDRQSARGGKE